MTRARGPVPRHRALPARVVAAANDDEKKSGNNPWDSVKRSAGGVKDSMKRSAGDVKDKATGFWVRVCVGAGHRGCLRCVFVVGFFFFVIHHRTT